MKLLKGEIRTVKSVTDEEIKFIFDTLYKDYYDGVSYEDYFLEHFKEKDYVLLFLIDGIIKGFSLQQVIPITVDDKEVLVLWAGDILIHPDFWGKNDYRYQLSMLCSKLYEENPEKLVYRLATPKGYKTFKIIPKLFHEYYPSPAYNDYPEFEAKIVDKILSSKYPATIYQKDKMMLVVPDGDHRLKEGFAQITSDKMSDPLIKFFYERNPDYARGNEIPVISPIRPDNLKSQQKYAAHLLQNQYSDQ